MAVIAATGDPTASAAFMAAVRHVESTTDVSVRPFAPDDGAELESRIRDRAFAAVLDFCPVELLTGTAGPDRLTAAGTLGIPQLISVCGLDFHPTEMRPTTAEERDALGKVIVERACAATGPTRIALPLRGFRGEGPNDPLFQSIRSWVYPPELLVEIDFAVNEAGFGVACAEALIRLLS